MALPTRKRGSMAVADVQSFIRYVNSHKTPATIVVAEVKETSASFRSVIDYHESGVDGKAAWREHSVSYGCPQSPEWKRWTANDKRPMSQQEFATFLEDNLIDIVCPANSKMPTGAEMLEVAKSIEASKSGKFKSSKRLEDGSFSLVFEENTTAKAGNNYMDVPSEFMLGLKPFFNGETYPVSARLRFRIPDGKLTLWYELVRPHLVIESACKKLIENIKAETGIEPFMGA